MVRSLYGLLLLHCKLENSSPCLHNELYNQFISALDSGSCVPIQGYPMVHGRMDVADTLFADWGTGARSCQGVRSYAIANHALAPDAFHPHYFQRTTLANVPAEALFKLYGPSPKWRNPTDCGTDVYDSTHPLSVYDSNAGQDATSIPLNCAGPRHVFFADMDGSLTGQRGTVLGHMSQRRSKVEQGAGVLEGACSHDATWQAYKCVPEFNSSSFPAGTRSSCTQPMHIGLVGL